MSERDKAVLRSFALASQRVAFDNQILKRLAVRNVHGLARLAPAARPAVVAGRVTTSTSSVSLRSNLAANM